MQDISFKQWFAEYADFGLDMGKKLQRVIQPDDEKPLYPINLEYVTKDLLTQNLGTKKGKDVYFGEVQWGEGPGALKVTFGPFRGLNAVIRKQCTDLQGETRWICKKVLEVGNYYDKHADSLTVKILDLLKEVDTTNIEAPTNTYEGMERLVLHMASSLRRYTTQTILQYEGIRRLVENKHYIIHFACTGAGVQRQGQKRLDQLHVEMKYDQEGGYIKVAVNEIGDKIKAHKWQIDPSQYCEYYMPTQPQDEIIGTMVSLLNSY